MNLDRILDAYRNGEIRTDEFKEQLNRLKVKSPLSEGQKGLWALQKMNPRMTAYNIPITIRFKVYEENAFREACRLTMSQHPILTSRIVEEDGIPYQIHRPALQLYFQTERFSQNTDGPLSDFLMKRAKMPFQLDQDALIRFFVISQPDQGVILLIVIHHIIFDGISTPVLIESIFENYRRIQSSEAEIASSSKAGYREFVEWDQEFLRSQKGDACRDYWLKELEGELPVLEIPSDRPRSSTLSFKGKTIAHRMDRETSRKLKELGKRLSVNQSVLQLGIFKMLLYHYTAETDIIVGMPTMGRPDKKFSDLIGYFVNMIAIRSRSIAEKSFPDFLKELQRTMATGMDHAAYPFPRLVDDLKGARSRANTPVFQVLYGFHHYFPPDEIGNTSLREAMPFELIQDIHQEGEFEFGLEIFNWVDGFLLNLKFNPDLFDDETIRRIMRHYLQLVEAVVEEPNLKTTDYSILTKSEYDKILKQWNETDRKLPDFKPIPL